MEWKFHQNFIIAKQIFQNTGKLLLMVFITKRHFARYHLVKQIFSAKEFAALKAGFQV